MRRLTALAAGAALLGLLASGLVRWFFPDLMAAMTTVVAEAAPTEEHGQPDAGPESRPAREASGPSADSPPRARSTAPSVPAVPSKRAERGGRGKRSLQAAAPEGDAFTQTLRRGVRRLGPNRYEVDRGALELALRNLRALSASVRVAPALRDGKPIGFRLFAVSPAGPIAKLGLRDDDILVSVNGIDITTPDRVLGAYAKLKAADDLALGVLRDGRTMVVTYLIR
jgi:hypothetical protein